MQRQSTQVQAFVLGQMRQKPVTQWRRKSVHGLPAKLCFLGSEKKYHPLKARSGDQVLRRGFVGIGEADHRGEKKLVSTGGSWQQEGMP